MNSNCQIKNYFSIISFLMKNIFTSLAKKYLFNLVLIFTSFFLQNNSTFLYSQTSTPVSITFVTLNEDAAIMQLEIN